MSSAATTPTQQLDVIGPTGLRITAPLTFDQWQALGYTLGGISKAIPWNVGDWYVLGETLWGEAYAQGLSSEIGIKAETVMHYARVARMIPPAQRQPTLSFFAHDLVARLPPKQRDGWLKKAVAGGWNSTRLKAELAAAKALPPVKPGPSEEKPSVTPREALTLMKNDPIWSDVASAALVTLDATEAVETLTCPSCNHQWTLA